MNPSQHGVLDNYSRFFLVLLLVVALCNSDKLFGKSEVYSAPAPEAVPYSMDVHLREAYPRKAYPKEMYSRKVHGATDKARSEALAGFIRTEFKNSAHIADKLARTSLQVARETGVSATLVLAVAGVESSLRPNADNGVDKGLMQVNPRWHPEKVARIGGAHKLFDLRLGMLTGARVLAEYTRAADGDQVAALLRYNGATSMNKYPGKVLTLKRKFDTALLQAGRT